MTTLNPTAYGAPLSGTLTGSSATVSVNNLKPISTIVFNSTTTPTITLSVDGTTFYPAVTPTGTKTGQLYYVLNFPVLAIKFTGATSDTWAII
jgi:hypothetical protein